MHIYCAKQLLLPKLDTEMLCEKLCFGVSLIKFQAGSSATFLKRDSNTAVSCEICKILMNNCFEQHLWTTASALHKVKMTKTEKESASDFLSLSLFFDSSI